MTGCTSSFPGLVKCFHPPRTHLKQNFKLPSTHRRYVTSYKATHPGQVLCPRLTHRTESSRLSQERSVQHLEGAFSPNNVFWVHTHLSWFTLHQSLQTEATSIGHELCWATQEVGGTTACFWGGRAIKCHRTWAITRKLPASLEPKGQKMKWH